jgi:hypothetical protein
MKDSDSDQTQMKDSELFRVQNPKLLDPRIQNLRYPEEIRNQLQFTFWLNFFTK